MPESPTTIARRQLLSYKQLKELVLKSDSPYLGTVPEALTSVANATPQELEAGLDWLAFKLQSPDGIALLKPSKLKSFFGKTNRTANPVEKLLQKNKIQVKVLGSGIAGNVYQVQIQGHDFALKVFSNNRNSMDVYRESATGMFFTERETQDLSRFYAANPVKKWVLMEFMPPNATLAGRPGTTFAQQGVKLSDHNAKNMRGEVRVDHGGIVTIIGEGFMAADEFKRFSQIKNGRPTSTISVERPDNLATTQADWDSFDDMCDNMPLHAISTMISRGNMAKAVRHKLPLPPAQEEQSSPSTTENETEEEAGSSSVKPVQHRFNEMLLAGQRSRQTRRKNAEDEDKDFESIYELYENS